MMEYTMITGEVIVNNPEITVRSISINQLNAPSYTMPDNKFSEPFRYKFSCLCNGKNIEFEFENESQIFYGEYTWPEAIKKWLIPYLAKEVK